MCSNRFIVFFFKQKTAYEMRISDWSSDVCSSDLFEDGAERLAIATVEAPPIVAVGGKAVALEYLPRDAKPEDIVDKRTANGKFHIAATMFADLEVDEPFELVARSGRDRKRTRLNSSH